MHDRTVTQSANVPHGGTATDLDLIESFRKILSAIHRENLGDLCLPMRKSLREWEVVTATLCTLQVGNQKMSTRTDRQV